MATAWQRNLDTSLHAVQWKTQCGCLPQGRTVAKAITERKGAPAGAQHAADERSGTSQTHTAFLFLPAGAAAGKNFLQKSVCAFVHLCHRPRMTTLKTTLEDLIKAERACEAALVRTLTNASQFRTAHDSNGAELIERERLNIAMAQNIIRQSKGRLQALADYTQNVPRGTRRRFTHDRAS